MNYTKHLFYCYCYHFQLYKPYISNCAIEKRNKILKVVWVLDKILLNKGNRSAIFNLGLGLFQKILINKI